MKKAQAGRYTPACATDPAMLCRQLALDFPGLRGLGAHRVVAVGRAFALVAGDAAQTQAHALALLIQADDLRRDDLARMEQIARLRLRVDIQLAGVDEPLDGLLDLHERTERRDVRHR